MIEERKRINFGQSKNKCTSSTLRYDSYANVGQRVRSIEYAEDISAGFDERKPDRNLSESGKIRSTRSEMKKRIQHQKVVVDIKDRHDFDLSAFKPVSPDNDKSDSSFSENGSEFSGTESCNENEPQAKKVKYTHADLDRHQNYMPISKKKNRSSKTKAPGTATHNDAFPDLDCCRSRNNIISELEIVPSNSATTGINNSVPDLSCSSSNVARNPDEVVSSRVYTSINTSTNSAVPDLNCSSSVAANINNAVPDSSGSSGIVVRVPDEVVSSSANTSNNMNTNSAVPDLNFSHSNNDVLRSPCETSSNNINSVDDSTSPSTTITSRKRFKSSHFSKSTERNGRSRKSTVVDTESKRSSSKSSKRRITKSRYFSSKHDGNGDQSDTPNSADDFATTSTSTSSRRTNRSSPQNEQKGKRTKSFDACWAGNIRKFLSDQPCLDSPSAILNNNTSIKIHTLILGTHPSVKSLDEHKYYANPLNAFWWIAGDCLGFRRDTGVSNSTQKPYALTKDLYYKRSQDIIPYEKQLETMCNKGFAIWDLIKSCERKGSLDVNIKKPEINDIKAFCDAHPSIRRICFSNGQTQCKLFMKHFKDWWKEDLTSGIGKSIPTNPVSVLVPEHNEVCVKIFGQQYSKRIYWDDYFSIGRQRFRKIKCVCMVGVSPANATASYAEKRDYWKRYCYDPGLKDNEELNVQPMATMTI